MTAHDEGIAIGGGEDEGSYAPHADTACVCEMLVAVEQLCVVVVIPVATQHHTPVGEGSRVAQRALRVETAEAGEGVAGGVVALHAEGLPDAEGLAVAASYDDITLWRAERAAVVVGVDGGQQVPLAVGVEFGRRRGHEAAGMAAHHGELAAGAEQDVAGARHVQVGQALHLQLPYRTGCPAGPGRKGGEQQAEAGKECAA